MKECTHNSGVHLETKNSNKSKFQSPCSKQILIIATTNSSVSSLAAPVNNRHSQHNQCNALNMPTCAMNF